MRKRKKIKCGEYLYKDGVIIKRPGKRFYLPELPSSYKRKYPTEDELLSACVFFKGPLGYSETYDNIDEMNAHKEWLWQSRIKEQHSTLRTLYYISQIKKITRKVVRHVGKHISRLVNAVVKEYDG